MGIGGSVVKWCTWTAHLAYSKVNHFPLLIHFDQKSDAHEVNSLFWTINNIVPPDEFFWDVFGSRLNMQIGKKHSTDLRGISPQHSVRHVTKRANSKTSQILFLLGIDSHSVGPKSDYQWSRVLTKHLKYDVHQPCYQKQWLWGLDSWNLLPPGMYASPQTLLHFYSGLLSGSPIPEGAFLPYIHINVYTHVKSWNHHHHPRHGSTSSYCALLLCLVLLLARSFSLSIKSLSFPLSVLSSPPFTLFASLPLSLVFSRVFAHSLYLSLSFSPPLSRSLPPTLSHTVSLSRSLCSSLFNSLSVSLFNILSISLQLFLCLSLQLSLCLLIYVYIYIYMQTNIMNEV